MKFLILYIGLVFTGIVVVDINEVRDLYKDAKQSKDNTEKFLKVIQKANHRENTVLSAYYGCALTLKASFSEKRGDKISFFKQGKKLIETAIESDSNNVELRMIRLSVQSSAPKITRYNKNIEEDKNFINSNIDKVSSPELKKFIKGFVSRSKAFNE